MIDDPNAGGLILPPGAQPPKPIPQCPGCEQEFEPGQVVVHFIGAVRPGGVKLAPIHLSCALQSLMGAEQEAGEEAPGSG